MRSILYLLCKREAIRPNPGCRPRTAAGAAGDVVGAGVDPKSEATGSYPSRSFLRVPVFPDDSVGGEQ